MTEPLTIIPIDGLYQIHRSGKPASAAVWDRAAAERLLEMLQRKIRQT